MKGKGGPARYRLSHRLAGVALVAVALAGCKTADPTHTGSISSGAIIQSSDLDPHEAVAAVQRWGAAYSADGRDKVAALNYAAALRAAGETDQAVAVMRKAAIYHSEDREVLAAYGKALAANGQFQEALSTIRRAQHTDNPDWQLLAAEGGILDSVGKHEDARALYRQALVLAPGEPQILNNFGMSYVLTGELEQAEATLRQAAAMPNATRQVHDNLAMVLRLQGGGEAAGLAPTEGGGAAPSPQGAAGVENVWDELADSG